MFRVKKDVDIDVLVKKYGFTLQTLSEKCGLSALVCEDKGCVTIIRQDDRIIYTGGVVGEDRAFSPVSDVVYKLMDEGLVESVT